MYNSNPPTSGRTYPTSGSLTVEDILCHELGASDLKEALSHARLIKRELGSARIAMQDTQHRLSHVGMESVEEAVVCIATLNAQLQALQAERDNLARANATDSNALQRMVEWLYGKIRTFILHEEQLTNRFGTADPDAIAQRIEEVEAERDELRLELWISEQLTTSASADMRNGQPLSNTQSEHTR